MIEIKLKNRIYCIAVLLAFLTACSGGKDSGAAMGGSGHPPQQLPVLKVDTMTLSNYRSYPVSIEGIKNIAIQAKVDGYITKVHIDEGQFVKRGERLFTLESRALTQSAKAAKAVVEVAQIEVERIKPLVEKKIVSEIQLKSAEASLAQAESNYQNIIANINYTNITSPTTGYVGEINYREGSLVSSASPMPITSISSIDQVYGYFSLNEKAFLTLMRETKGGTQQEKIDNIPTISLNLADGSEYEHRGVIETVTGNIDKTTGAVTLRATFQNPNSTLKDGSSGIISIPKHYNGAVVIPAESTFDIQGNIHIYTVDSENSVQGRVISVEETIGKYIVVKEGLKRGETILAKGIGKVRPGAKITPQPTTMEAIIGSFSTVFK